MNKKSLDITENNKLIARFMGGLPHGETKLTQHMYPGQWWLPHHCIIRYPEDMKYHESWNWLMKVVERIESIEDPHHGYFQVHIHSNACDIQGTNLWKSIQGKKGYNTPETSVYMSDPNAILGSKLESTYYNVIAFIKWYNERTNEGNPKN